MRTSNAKSRSAVGSNWYRRRQGFVPIEVNTLWPIGSVCGQCECVEWVPGEGHRQHIAVEHLLGLLQQRSNEQTKNLAKVF